MEEEYEEFEWKDPKNIWKGVGIYHITFVVSGRKRLLGELVAEFPDVSRPFYRNLTKRVPAVNERGDLAMVWLYETYENPVLIERTEATLKAKDEAKGYKYKPLPHNSKRWRMIAGNEMLRMVSCSFGN